MDFILPFGKPFWQVVKGQWNLFLSVANFAASYGFYFLWATERVTRRNITHGLNIFGPQCVVGFNGIVFQLTRAADFSELGKNWLSFPVYWGQGTSLNVPAPGGVSLQSQSSYDSIGTEVPGHLDNRQKILDALELARSWGWSHAFSKSDRIISGNFVSWVDSISDDNTGITGMAIPGGIFPFPEISIGIGPFSITKGGPIQWGDRIALNPTYVADWPVERLAFLLVHEALHHTMYRYALDLYDHHLAIAMASIINAMCLYTKPTQLATPDRWPGDFGVDVQIGGTPTKNVTDPPNLSNYSQVTVTPTFSQKLNEMADIIGTWGIGGWVDEFKPPLNYIGSGVGQTKDYELILDLDAPSVDNAWRIIGATMMITSDEWAQALQQDPERPPLRNELNRKYGVLRATLLGMFTLTIKIGINKGG